MGHLHGDHLRMCNWTNTTCMNRFREMATGTKRDRPAEWETSEIKISEEACVHGVVVDVSLVSQAIRLFPRAHARRKGGGGREGKIRLVRCARFSFQSGM